MCAAKREGGRKGRRGEVLSRTRVLGCFILHSFTGERRKNTVKRGRRSTSGASESFNLKFMEAAFVKNEDLVCGLRSSGQSTA